MEMTRRARTAVVLAIVAMLVAAGLVGYGIGFQHGMWESSDRGPVTEVADAAAPAPLLP